MPDALDRFPIVKTNAVSVRQNNITNIAVYAVLSLMASGTIFFFSNDHFHYPINLIGFALSIVPWGIFLYLYISGARAGTIIDKLIIDEAGIHITRLGIPTDYLWPDIQSTKIVPIESATRAPPRVALKIVRKGSVDVEYDGTDLISEDFGLSASEITGIVKLCISRFEATVDVALRRR